jgi:hypothetical protein
MNVEPRIEVMRSAFRQVEHRPAVAFQVSGE